MGTRADFYVGTLRELEEGTWSLSDAEWLGSKSMDGFPPSYGGSVPYRLLNRRAESTWRNAVAELLKEHPDATTPEQGWPWPWETSYLTDWVYVFDPTINQVHLINFQTHRGTFSDYLRYTKAYAKWETRAQAAGERLSEEEYEEWEEAHPAPEAPERGEVVGFPDMTEIQNVVFGPRSGVLVVGRH